MKRRVVMLISVSLAIVLSLTLAFETYSQSEKRELEIFNLLLGIDLVIDELESDLDKQSQIIESENFHTELENYAIEKNDYLNTSKTVSYMFEAIEDLDKDYIDLNVDLHYHYSSFLTAESKEIASQDHEVLKDLLIEIKKIRDYLASINDFENEA
ncbi:hypothetical protein [Jeotgalibacillus sp. R-1-5s-1]|uniref:hypothetical protein n=1 Tax=Jeotgalibacillus sp. R-1-5s-1 TaxID=2555897 RepID=UPI00106C6445|nr:hypothetical protein [Jeotgalibacillus sp. R-1-5s-1]TFD93675.1 hypothetical protein E2491_14660 [Jeotgalibacillus sp. R-1-5s-1]